MRALPLVLCATFAVMVVMAGVHDVLAQTGPFGTPRPPAAPAPEGVTAWILARQAEFYRSLSALVRQAKADGSALWALFGVSFLYGVFHAAGPGHGKAVISSYMVANDETWRRGVVLSLVSAMLQALVAVVVVGIAAAILNVTYGTMTQAVYWIEIVSYGLIALIGARLTWVKGRALLVAWRGSAAHENGPDHHDRHGHAHHHHHHHHHEHHAHDGCARDHDHSGHSHGPEPQELAGPGGWQRGLAAIFAVGLRPCSGAILVLVFALAQGMFWAGAASAFIMGLGTAVTVAAIATLAVGAKSLAQRLAGHRGGTGVLAMRGLEVIAALLVLAFGLALLTGYVANERIGF